MTPRMIVVTGGAGFIGSNIVARLTKAALAWHQSLPPDNGPALGAEPAAPKAGGKKKAK